jgi:hypothetical protein
VAEMASRSQGRGGRSGRGEEEMRSAGRMSGGSLFKHTGGGDDECDAPGF